MRYPQIVERMMLDALATAVYHNDPIAVKYATAVKQLTVVTDIERAIVRWLADRTQGKQLLETLEMRMLELEE